MKAMILAAGLGTRLRPLTDDRPKALVEIEGRTLLEITLARLQSFGVHDVIVNVHHFADQIAQYLQANSNFGMRIVLSREDELLDTGGGLKKAGFFFLEGADAEQPFIVHNVDVLSTIDLAKMVRYHLERRALATLAVQERKTSRYLLFDEQLRLCGRGSGENEPEMVPPVNRPLWLAFSGVHVISPRLLDKMTEQGAFSIVDTYVRLASAGEPVFGFRADAYYWRDLGKLESVTRAAEDVRQGAIAL